MKSKKPNPPLRKCKVRINVQRFESIRLSLPIYGFEVFQHSLN